jgi:hypothetical protein
VIVLSLAPGVMQQLCEALFVYRSEFLRRSFDRMYQIELAKNFRILKPERRSNNWGTPIDARGGNGLLWWRRQAIENCCHVDPCDKIISAKQAKGDRSVNVQ